MIARAGRPEQAGQPSLAPRLKSLQYLKPAASFAQFRHEV